MSHPLAMIFTLLASAALLMGYSLVWGQLSFWIVTQTVNALFSLDVIAPGLGSALVKWFWGF